MSCYLHADMELEDLGSLRAPLGGMRSSPPSQKILEDDTEDDFTYFSPNQYSVPETQTAATFFPIQFPHPDEQTFTPMLDPEVLSYQALTYSPLPILVSPSQLFSNSAANQLFADPASSQLSATPATSQLFANPAASQIPATTAPSRLSATPASSQLFASPESSRLPAPLAPSQLSAKQAAGNYKDRPPIPHIPNNLADQRLPEHFPNSNKTRMSPAAGLSFQFQPPKPRNPTKDYTETNHSNRVSDPYTHSNHCHVDSQENDHSWFYRNVMLPMMDHRRTVTLIPKTRKLAPLCQPYCLIEDFNFEDPKAPDNYTQELQQVVQTDFRDIQTRYKRFLTIASWIYCEDLAQLITRFSEFNEMLFKVTKTESDTYAKTFALFFLRVTHQHPTWQNHLWEALTLRLPIPLILAQFAEDWKIHQYIQDDDV